jgi:acetyltransferase
MIRSPENQVGVDSASEDFCLDRRPLDAIFRARSIAVIGATAREGSVGRTLIDNLRKTPFGGKLYLVNPKHEEIFGLRCYPKVASLPAQVDLAVVITPALTVPGVIGECVRAGIPGAVVISAGFKECGAAGARLEQEIRQELRGSKMRLIGPNCLGIMNPITGINATFAHDMALPGSVAFLSQSGALETAILDWSLQERVGFSAVVSTGSMLDVSWADLIDYFGEDQHTRSILLYLESVGDARSFLSAAREVALRKPIIVIKAGRSEAASHAATSHTGALTGSDEVFDAAVRRCGILRVQSISDLFHLAETLDRQPRPHGPRLTILTNAGGPGVLATDALIANGGELAPLSDSSIHALSEFLSPYWSHGNPIDVLGDARAEDYGRAFEIAIHDPSSDGMLAILAPQGMTDPTGVADRLKSLAHDRGKPVLASWMGGKLVAEGMKILNEAGISTFAYPDTAARAFCYMAHYSYNLRSLYETPSLAEEVQEGDESRQAVSRILESVRTTGRTLLTETESKQVLARYRISTVDTRVAHSEDQAAAIARIIGFPVVLKVHSETITHKTDVGGVKLNLENEEAVRRAYREIEVSVGEKAGAEKFQGVTIQPMVSLAGYELILGSSVDPQFGPVILFGSGGQLVEVYRDRALALPPLNATLAQRLMEQTRIFKALKGVRGRAPVDMNALERVLVRFSRLIMEQPWIKEVDINPLLASSNGILALDARIVLYAADMALEQLPKPAIRPYPSQYVRAWKTKTAMTVLIRPIRPEDEPLMAKFHEGLSRASVYLRYFHMESLDERVSHIRLMRQCFVDYDREMALVADFQNPESGEHQILAIGRLTKTRGEPEAEAAVMVTDAHQDEGLGTELVRRLIDIGRDEKLARIVAKILPENEGMKALVRHLNFRTEPSPDPNALKVVLDLQQVSSSYRTANI